MTRGPVSPPWEQAEECGGTGYSREEWDRQWKPNRDLAEKQLATVPGQIVESVPWGAIHWAWADSDEGGTLTSHPVVAKDQKSVQQVHDLAASHMHPAIWLGAAGAFFPPAITSQMLGPHLWEWALVGVGLLTGWGGVVLRRHEQSAVLCIINDPEEVALILQPWREIKKLGQTSMAKRMRGLSASWASDAMGNLYAELVMDAYGKRQHNGTPERAGDALAALTDAAVALQELRDRGQLTKETRPSVEKLLTAGAPTDETCRLIADELAGLVQAWDEAQAVEREARQAAELPPAEVSEQERELHRQHSLDAATAGATELRETRRRLEEEAQARAAGIQRLRDLDAGQ